MTTDRTAILATRGVSRRQPDSDQLLLDDVSLELGGGDRVAIVGPSGGGKTLLLRALCLLDSIESGEIRWRGEQLEDGLVPQFRRQVVLVHQRPALAEGSVEENLRRPYALKTNRRGRYEPDRVSNLLGALGRDGSFLSKSQRDLSAGEAQLVALVRAMQFEPEALLLDEPTAALDGQTSRAVEKLVAGWLGERPERRAYIWVSHDMAQARRVADQVYRMQAGRLEREELK